MGSLMDLPALGLDIPALLEAYVDEVIPWLVLLAGAHVAFAWIEKVLSWGRHVT